MFAGEVGITYIMVVIVGSIVVGRCVSGVMTVVVTTHNVGAFVVCRSVVGVRCRRVVVIAAGVVGVVVGAAAAVCVDVVYGDVVAGGVVFVVDVVYVVAVAVTGVVDVVVAGDVAGVW